MKASCWTWRRVISVAVVPTRDHQTRVASGMFEDEVARKPKDDGTLKGDRKNFGIRLQFTPDGDYTYRLGLGSHPNSFPIPRVALSHSVSANLFTKAASLSPFILRAGSILAPYSGLLYFNLTLSCCSLSVMHSLVASLKQPPPFAPN